MIKSPVGMDPMSHPSSNATEQYQFCDSGEWPVSEKQAWEKAECQKFSTIKIYESSV